MKIFIAGATGAIGRPLCRMLVAAGHSVVGISRSPQRAASLGELGVEGVICDALDRDATVEAIERAEPDLVVSQLTDLPARMQDAEKRLEATDRARAEGTENLVEGARRTGARPIAQSIAWIYDPDDPSPASEDDRLWPDPPSPFDRSLQRLREMEESVTEAAGTVLRYGFFYGPGTWFGPGGDALTQLRRRMLPRIGDGGGVWSFIHVEDAARATVAAIETPSASGIYNVCDDRPVPSERWLPAFAEAAGAPRPLKVPRWLARVAAGDYTVALMCEIRGVSNARAKRELGWSPGFADPLEGFEAVFES